MPKGIKCVKCGHSSVVRSNFKGLSDGRFYCNSDKRPNCENERQYELRMMAKPETPSYNPITKW